MGSGKTTLGRELAASLNESFIDLDKYLEEKYFKSIPKIFEEEGEAEFRKKEQHCLKEVSEFEDVIIATGGGAPCFFDNMDVMNQTGYCVFLDVPSEELANRLKQAKIERPLIKGKSPEELVDFINEMMDKRRPFYEKAKYIMTGADITAKDILTNIKEGNG